MIGVKEFGLWVLAAIWTVLALWPASTWYSTGALRIDDYRQGEVMQIAYSGGPARQFKGSYSVVIRNASSGEIVSEDRSSVFTYKTGVTRPDPITINWWAPGDERAFNLPAGTYVMETCWTVHRVFGGLVPAKHTCTESNIFRVM